MLDISSFPFRKLWGQLTQPIWRFLGDFQTVQPSPKHLGPWSSGFLEDDDLSFFGMGKALPILQANLLFVFLGFFNPGEI